MDHGDGAVQGREGGGRPQHVDLLPHPLRPRRGGLRRGAAGHPPDALAPHAAHRADEGAEGQGRRLGAVDRPEAGGAGGAGGGREGRPARPRSRLGQGRRRLHRDHRLQCPEHRAGAQVKRLPRGGRVTTR